MNKRFLVFLLAVCLVFSGCQLATDRKADVPSTAGDTVIGVLVSFDTLGGEPIEDNAIHSKEMEGKKLYAELVDGKYRFPDGTGIWMMSYLIQDEAGDYWRSSVDEAVHMVTNHHRVADKTNTVELQGEIYPAMASQDLSIFLHPIYQTADGRVYAVGTGPGGYAGPNASGAGEGFGASLGEEGSYAGIRLSTVPTPETYVLVQMDDNDGILSRREFTPEEMPDTFTPERDCAYLILEAHSREDTVERTICNPGENMESYRLLENGLCARQTTVIDWEGAK